MMRSAPIPRLFRFVLTRTKSCLSWNNVVITVFDHETTTSLVGDCASCISSASCLFLAGYRILTVYEFTSGTRYPSKVKIYP
ncbi:hypothetical protein Plhal304r1_c024g0083241 [Plasmopara halstedii]